LYSGFLVYIGRFEEAYAESEKAVELDPNSFHTQIIRALVFQSGGRHDDALREARNEKRIFPAHPFWYWISGYSHGLEGRYAPAIEALKTAVNLMGEDTGDELSLLGYFYGRAGQRANALEILERLEQLSKQGRYISPVARSWVYVGLGDEKSCLSSLEKGYEERDSWLPLYIRSQLYDSIRDHPRFQDLLRRMNFPE
jgi:tetratricopeptide (TPR) repeat protein